MNKTYFILIALYILVLTIVGCSQAGTEPTIEQIQKSSPVVKVGDLMGNPDSYKGQMVVLAGKIIEVCPSDG